MKLCMQIQRKDFGLFSSNPVSMNMNDIILERDRFTISQRHKHYYTSLIESQKMYLHISKTVLHLRDVPEIERVGTTPSTA